MKRFTIICSILLILGFAGTLVYVGMSPDFVEPGALAAEGEDPNAPVWNMTMDDILDYLEEKGLWDRNNMTPISPGVGTEAYACNGAEVYWWDLDNLAEGTNEYAAYQDMKEGGMIDIWQQGTMFMPVTKNGPFGLCITGYKGNATEILDAFAAFGQTGGGTPSPDAPVWNMTMEDLLVYMEDKGYIDRSSTQLLATSGFCSEAYLISGIEFSWWDLENLDENSAEYAAFEDMSDGDGIVMIYGTYPYAVTPNGPFCIYFRGDFAGDVNEVIDAFKAFGRE